MCSPIIGNTFVSVAQLRCEQYVNGVKNRIIIVEYNSWKGKINRTKNGLYDYIGAIGAAG
jgi:hypothetical protein